MYTVTSLIITGEQCGSLEKVRRGCESGICGSLVMCLRASHIAAPGSVIPCALEGRGGGGGGEVSCLLYLLEAVNLLPGIPIRSANVSFLFKAKWYISIRTK